MIYLFCLFVWTNAVYCQTKVSHQYLIYDITIIDVQNGNLLPHRSIGIDNDRITEIYKHNVLPSATTTVIDGRGKYIIPGLWDMHVHYYWHYKTSTHLL
jgi:imidazolonepropionase-like amidohydrolase